jgi:hypothetical protein
MIGSEVSMSKLKSRKLWAAIFGSLAPIVGSALTDEISVEKSITLSAGVIISYLFGQGIADHGKAG